MSSQGFSVLDASSIEQNLIVGPQGKTIIALAKRFNVRIDLPKSPSITIKIFGGQHQAALEAIQSILGHQKSETKSSSEITPPTTTEAISSLIGAESVSSLQLPSFYYLKYRLYVICSMYWLSICC